MLNIAQSRDTAPSTVMLVDDHPLFRVGLRTMLLRELSIERVVEAGTLDEALALSRQLQIDVALVDVLMPESDGVVVTARLHALQPTTKILGLSMINEPIRIAAMFRAGAVGYVLKLQPVPEVIEAMRTVLGGRRYLPPSIQAETIDELALVVPFEGLTRREREVLHHLIRGHSNDRIATLLFISRRTVESHRQNLLKKLGVHTIIELLHVAVRAGLLED